MVKRLLCQRRKTPKLDRRLAPIYLTHRSRSDGTNRRQTTPSTGGCSIPLAPQLTTTSSGALAGPFRTGLTGPHHHHYRSACHPSPSWALTASRCDVATRRCAVTEPRCDVATRRCAVTEPHCDGATRRCSAPESRCDVATLRCSATEPRCDVATRRCAATEPRCDVATLRCAGPPDGCGLACLAGGALIHPRGSLTGLGEITVFLTGITLRIRGGRAR